MNLAALLSSREGRISRKSFWIAILCLGLVNLAISLIVSLSIGGGALGNMMAGLQAGGTSPEQRDSLLASGRSGAWASLVITLVFAYPAYAVMVKRRHDRNSAGLDVLVFLGLTLLSLLVGALGIGMEVMQMPLGNGTTLPVPVPGPALAALQMANGIFALYLLVVLGFLRGTAGENDYGPDPLAG